ncbi:kynureninase [Thermomonospora umbrina]|nr:kynureninase [Thermomonospora umbrina]
MTVLSRAECAALDAADPLADLRAEFALPDGVIYLDGNSLGALPRRTSERVRDTIERQWGERLIRSWNEAGWWDLPTTLGDRLARLLGAAPGQVAVCDSTSVNLFKVLTAALRMRPGRTAVVAESGSFPTDLYIAEGVAGAVGGVDRRLVSDASELPGALGDDVAVVLLNHVDYRTGRLHDMAAVTRLIHDHGALAVWDLCHSAGALPIELDACGVDFAVGCGYKYLNGGPGAPAFVYAAARHLGAVEQPLSGWWGHAEPFAFETGYAPAPGIRRFLTGSQPIIGGTALAASLDVWDRVDMTALRAKSLALTDLFMRRAEQAGLDTVTPREPERRGSQVALRVRTGDPGDGYAIVQALIDRDVIGDFRAPDIMRFGFTPLYLRYVDVWDAADALTDVLTTEPWKDDRYTTRNPIT